MNPTGTAAATESAGFCPAPGNSVEIDVFGRKVIGTVLRSGPESIAVRIPQLADLRSMRVGTRVKALFAVSGAAAEVSCRLYSMPDHVVLKPVGKPRVIQRRRHERLPLQVSVALAWWDRDAGTWAHTAAVTQDVSVSGARVTLTPVRPGLVAGAVLLLALPAPARVETGARIVQADGAVARLEFIDPPEAFFPALLAAGR
jgi:PilZ domain